MKKINIYVNNIANFYLIAAISTTILTFLVFIIRYIIETDFLFSLSDYLWLLALGFIGRYTQLSYFNKKNYLSILFMFFIYIAISIEELSQVYYRVGPIKVTFDYYDLIAYFCSLITYILFHFLIKQKMK